MNDVEALTVVLRRGSYNVRGEDESRHEAQARAILASDWLATYAARIRAEALGPVLALADELRGVPPYEGLEAVSTAWVVGRLRATTTDHTTDAARAVDAENGGEHG